MQPKVSTFKHKRALKKMAQFVYQILKPYKRLLNRLKNEGSALISQKLKTMQDFCEPYLNMHKKERYHLTRH